MADLQQEQQPDYDFLLEEARSITDTSLKDERLAKQLDDRLATIEGIPAGYLDTRRKMGELRNPYGGRFANTSVQMALIKAATYYPEVGQLQQFLAHKAGVVLPAPNYKALEQQERNRQLDQQMAQTAAELRASREKAMAAHNARLHQPGGLKFPAHLPYTGRGGGG